MLVQASLAFILVFSVCCLVHAERYLMHIEWYRVHLISHEDIFDIALWSADNMDFFRNRRLHMWNFMFAEKTTGRNQCAKGQDY